MKEITTRDLRESLTLLLLHLHEDGEGGWTEEWRPSHRIWGSIWPLIGSDMKGKYRITIRSEFQLPSRFAFLWHLHRESKQLLVISKPVLTHYNRFLSMIAKEEKDA